MMPKHREKLLRTTDSKKAASGPLQAQTVDAASLDRTQQVMHMQRVIGNQASLRLLRTPAKAPIPIRQTSPKSYMKRAVIQRNVMPYDTWKDYSDGGLLSFRPDELKTVDGIMKTYADLDPADQPAARRVMVASLKKYKKENADGWEKNKRSTAIDTLIGQIEEDQTMTQAGLQVVQLPSVSQFTSDTDEDGKYFGKVGQSGFQKEIIKRLTEFHELKDPTGADLDKGLALLYQMRDMAGYWVDQNQGKARRRLDGMRDFNGKVGDAIKLLEGYMGGQIRGGAQAPKAIVDNLDATPVQGGKNEQQKKDERVNQLKLTHEGGAESLFAKLGALISDHPGTKTEINVEVKFPIQHGVFLGAHLKVTAESDMELSAKENSTKTGMDQVKTQYTKIHSDLTATFGWEIPKIVELKGEIGGYLESRGETPKEAMLLMSYAFYRRLMDAKYGSSATRRVAGLIWGGYTGKSGVKMAELWGKKVEKTALDKDIAYAESGGTVIAGAKVGSKATVVDMGLKYQYFKGRKYTKKTIAAGNTALGKGEANPRFDEDNQWHEAKFEVGLAGIFRAELKVKVPTKTADQTKAAQKKQIAEATKKRDEATAGKNTAQQAVDAAQVVYDDAKKRYRRTRSEPAKSRARVEMEKAEVKLNEAKEKLQWWTDYETEQQTIVSTPEKDQSLPKNFELEAFTIFTVGATGWGAVLEGLLAELGMKLVEVMRKATGITGERGSSFTPTPAEWLSHATQFDKFNSPASYGILGKDNIKSGSLTGEKGSSPKDTATTQSGFSLTLSCKVKEGVATWLVSVERATEAGLNVGVFKADIKQKRRIFGFTIKKLATGDKDLSGKRTEKVNFALM